MTSEAPALALNHVGLTVPDVWGAIDWYVALFGCTHLMGPRLLEADPGIAGLFGTEFRRAYQAHLLTANGVGLELFQFIEPAVESPEPSVEYRKPGPWHIPFTHPAVHATIDRIVGSGGRRLTQALAFVPGRPWVLGYAADPWGTTLEVVSHSYAEMFGNWPQPGMTEPPTWIPRPTP